jgi:hypothetical protein
MYYYHVTFSVQYVAGEAQESTAHFTLDYYPKTKVGDCLTKTQLIEIRQQCEYCAIQANKMVENIEFSPKSVSIISVLKILDSDWS